MVGPVGTASFVLISGFLESGITFTNILLPSLNQCIGFPIFALRGGVVSLDTFAVTRSRIQISTAVSTV